MVIHDIIKSPPVINVLFLYKSYNERLNSEVFHWINFIYWIHNNYCMVCIDAHTFIWNQGEG